jgi:hypothetical protein
MKITKLNQDEINKLNEYQNEYKTIIATLGELEFKIQSLDIMKNDIKANIITLNNKEKALVKQLHDQYGEGSIDLEKGEITHY